MRRRDFLTMIGIGAGSLGMVGTASAQSDSHPVGDAMTFTWYSGNRMADGPMVLLDMNAASTHTGFWARFDVAANAREYAEYIYNSHEVWQEYSSVAAIEAEIEQHYPYAGNYLGGDNTAGIVLWEHGYGTPNNPPEDWDYECEDLSEWYTVSSPCR